MNKIEQYQQVFVECFGVSLSQLNDSFVYQCVPQWDSVGHMSMVTALEDAFGITLDTDDIIDFNSYAKGIEILRKYDVTV